MTKFKKILKRISTIITAGLLSLFLAMPAIAGDSSSLVGEDCRFVATNGGSFSGTGNTQTDETVGSHDVTAESQEVKHNRQSNDGLGSFFSGLGGSTLTDLWMYGDPTSGNAIYIEDFEIPIGSLIGLFDNNMFYPGVGDSDATGTENINQGYIPLNHNDEAATAFVNNIYGTWDEDDATNQGSGKGIRAYPIGTINPQDAKPMKGIHATWRAAQNSAFRPDDWTWSGGGFDNMNMSYLTEDEYNRLLQDMMNGGYFLIDGYPVDIYDQSTMSGRYDSLGDYLNDLLNGTYGPGSGRGISADGDGRNVSITDTVRVQHVVEYCAKSLTERVLYERTPVEYSSGDTGAYTSGGAYRWSIEFQDVEGGEYQFKTQGNDPISPLCTGQIMTFRFGLPGTYVIRAKQKMSETYYDTVSYNLNEFWILADTGQVIYSRTVNGGTGDKNSPAGRFSDVNTIYYKRQYASPNEVESNNDEYGVFGTVVSEQTHTVTEGDLNGMFPVSGFDDVATTIRIE